MTDDRRPRRDRDDPEGVRLIGADEAEAAMEREDVARRRRPEDPRPGDRPGGPPADAPEPVLRFPLSNERPDADLPHWSDPPTGEYGAVGGNIFDEPAEDPAAREWSTLSSSTPRWRDSDDPWAEADDLAAYGDDDTYVGALDERDRQPDDFFDFDQYEDPRQAPASSSVFEEPEAGVYYEDDLDYDEYEDADDYDEGRKIVIGGGGQRPEAPRVRSAHEEGGGGDRDLAQAAIVGGALFLAALVLFWLGPVFALLLVTAAVGLSAAEFFTKLREIGHEPIALVGVVGSVALPIAAYHRGLDGITTGMFLITVVSMVWFLVGAGEENASHNIGLTLLGVSWIGMLGAFGGALLALQGPTGIGDAGKGILFGAIITTIAYDVAGLFVGQAAGKSPLSDASPNKTIEGLIGGVVAALTVGVLYGVFVEPLGSVGDGLKLGLAVAVAAPLGDLCQSLIKRDLGIKDMGSVLPGHGGLTDRFDGLLFALPAVYFVARLSDFFL